MSDPVVRVEALRRVFSLRGGRHSERSELVAVRDVSLTVPAGGSVALVGESGSGKTTVGRLIVGLSRPTSGTIVVAGRARTARAPSGSERRLRARETQIVFQDPHLSLDRNQTIYSCLSEVVQFHFGLGGDELRARVAELLDKVGVAERYASCLPEQLSGGQCQRVAIARALAAEPMVLVLDEATSALDVSIQAQIINLLADLREQSSMSYLLISHDLAVVRQLCDEVLVMRAGEIIEGGTTDAILDSPVEDYTKRLIAAVPRPGWTPPTAFRAPDKLATRD